MATDPRPTGVPELPGPHRVDDPPLPETEQGAFFKDVLAAALRAESQVPVHEVYLDLAGTRIRVRFAGDAEAAAFLPALSHLVEPEGHADLTLHVWSSASSGVPMPPPPVPNHCFSNRGDIWRMSSRRYRSAYHWIESSVNVLDLATRTAVFWVPSLDGLPNWTKASPFRTLFHWWLESTGAQLIHGAAVGTDAGAVLITGRGGVGKSTTSLTALEHGMQYVGDDYVALRLDPEPRVYSLYCTAKLNVPQMDRFPKLGALVSLTGDSAEEKAVVNLHPARAAQVARSLPLVAIATPEFADAEVTTLGPASRLGLQRAATYTTLGQLPHAGEQLHAFIRRLVHAVPGYTLRLGRDLSRVPEGLHRALEPQAMLDHVNEVTAHEEPLITVIVPVYNGASFIRRAVDSILKQEYAGIELVIVDDGSTDDLDAALALLPCEFRLLRQENAGPAAARNRGIRDASGELIAFLDVDDAWPTDNLRRLVEVLSRDPAAALVHGRAQLVREEGGVDVVIGDPAEAFAWYIGAGLYRRRAFADVGLFDDALRFGEDEDWFRRAAERELNMCHLDEYCLFVRRHAANMTRGKSLKELNTLRVVKRAMDRNRDASSGRFLQLNG